METKSFENEKYFRQNRLRMRNISEKLETKSFENEKDFRQNRLRMRNISDKLEKKVETKSFENEKYFRQIGDKTGDKIKTHILCLINFLRKLYRL